MGTVGANWAWRDSALLPRCLVWACLVCNSRMPGVPGSIGSRVSSGVGRGGGYEGGRGNLGEGLGLGASEGEREERGCGQETPTARRGAMRAEAELFRRSTAKAVSLETRGLPYVERTKPR